MGTPFASHANLKASLLLKIRTWIGLKSIGILRRFFTDAVIYQSKFVKSCWEELYPNISADEYIIYNGVDVDLFNPEGKKHKTNSEITLVSVEGTQASPEKNPAFKFCQYLYEQNYDVELLVFGRSYKNSDKEWKKFPFVKYMGFVQNNELPRFLRAGTAFFSTDIIAACLIV